MPTNGQSVTVEYIYSDNKIQKVAFSMFAVSQYDDAYYTLAVKFKEIASSPNQIFKMTLYEKGLNGYYTVDQYEFSLDRIVNAVGKSIYIEDIFRDNEHLMPYINTAFTGTIALGATEDTIIDLTGGVRGAAPLEADFTSAWNFFKNLYGH
jgi:hypothetical protein